MTAASTAARSLPNWLLIIGLLYALGPLSIDLYLPAFPSIQRELGDGHLTVELSLSAYFVGLTLGQLLYGPTSDHLGRKPPLMFGLGLFVLACLGAASAQSMATLTAWRFVQGPGACACTVIPNAIVGDRYDERGAARAFSLLTLVWGVAPILGPLAGGLAMQHSRWPTLFLVLAAVGLGCLLLVGIGLSETCRPAPVAIVPGWRHSLGQYRALLCDRDFMGHCLSAASMAGCMFAYVAGSPFVLMDLHGVTTAHFGWYFGANALGLIAVSQLNALLLRHYAAQHLLRLGLGLCAVGAASLVILTGTRSAGLPLLAACLFFFVSSTALVMPNATAAALVSQSQRRGTAAALMGSLMYGLATFSGALVGLGRAAYPTSALPLACTLLLCTCFACAAQGLLLTGRVNPRG